ncbi:periplasmic heavy metal sensor [Amaricoccus solimangrovi]|uniref:Periplasmic heavy metal sensor n=1 Tax=Amaricoccus solimangrovi TaxID=2589815 RepID=A0A501WQ73_9RHOB|nr:periplasmic heavy metal sensor [Amaricoccus solimangrovi]TPE50244.1 periplasmic heavy metal sensor [Amaricoccus solimangrovi]
MADRTQPPTKTLPRPWRWAFIGSLCLNLALAGLIAGALLKGPPSTPPPGLWGYGRALPEPYRHDLSQALRDSRRDWMGPREELRGQRRALAEALTAKPYDPAAVEEVVTREPRLMDALAQRGSRLLLDQIGRMSPEDRAAFAEALRRKPKGPDRDERHAPREGAD